jgi:hypothetical protein
MAIYLGTNELSGGGGGGGIPIGGYAFFSTPAGTPFTPGQEVYTDPDGLVWIRTGATITSEGSGVLDASLYTLSSNIVTLSDPVVSFTGGGGYGGNTCFGYNGVHLQTIGLRASVGNPGAYALRTEENVSVSASNSVGSGPFSATVDATGWVFGSSFYNDTHAFTGFDRPGINSFGSSDKYAYQPFTAFTGGTAGYDQTNYFTVPKTFMACSHIQTTPRYWGVNGNSTAVVEYTFNPSAANGSNPFTATANTFTLQDAAQRFMTDGVDKFYVQNSTVLKEYDINGNLLNTFQGLPAAGLASSYHYGFVCVPSFKNSDGVTQFWTRTGGNTGNNTSFNTISRYDFPLALEGPYTGSPSSKTLVVTKDVGSNPILPSAYLWQRIA